MKNVKLTDKQIEFILAALERQGIQGIIAAEMLISVNKSFNNAKETGG